MTEVQKYWRDKLLNLLILGGGFVFILGGWSISEAHRFTLFVQPGIYGEAADLYRSIGLIVIVVSFSLIWMSAIRWIYKTHLSENVDATVLPVKMVRIYSWMIVLTLLVTTFFICL